MGSMQFVWVMFQFTPPCRGRLRAGLDLVPVMLFQFTPPCRGRPLQFEFFNAPKDVSIHAPVQGATLNRQVSTFQVEFQFTPPCRGRRLGPQLLGDVVQFQFTPPCRGRRRLDQYINDFYQFQFTPPCRGRHEPNRG